jgi:hypothetical protein
MPPTRPQTRQRGAVLRQPCYDRHRGQQLPSRTRARGEHRAAGSGLHLMTRKIRTG